MNLVVSASTEWLKAADFIFDIIDSGFTSFQLENADQVTDLNVTNDNVQLNS